MRIAIPLLLTTVVFRGCPSLIIVPDGNLPPGGRACTAVFVYGLNVTVTDAATGAAVTGATLTLTEQGRAYTEILAEIQPGVYVGAGERPGQYTLIVEAPGYRAQTITGIVITADECHVIPVQIQVAMPTG